MDILHEDQYSAFITSHSFYLIMRNVSDKICKANQNTSYIQIFFSFFLKSCRMHAEKYCRFGHTTDDNMAHAQCMLDT